MTSAPAISFMRFSLVGRRRLVDTGAIRGFTVLTGEALGTA